MGEPAAAFSFKAKARFADNLYRARERAGLSQKNAAARAALTPARLDKIEGGEAIPRFDALIRLARAPEVAISFCLFDDLKAEGPFAPIFRDFSNPEQPIDWLGG